MDVVHYIQLYTNYNTFSGTNYFTGIFYPNTTAYFRIRRSGTTLYYENSDDGISWLQIYTGGQPFVPAQMGVVTLNQNAGLTIYGYFDFFRYIASSQIGPIGRLG